MSNMSNLFTEIQEEGKRVILSIPEERLTKEELRAQTIKNRDQKIKGIIAQPIGKIEDVKSYWETCLALVYVAGSLASHDKLLMTYRDKAKSHNVKNVVENPETFQHGVASIKQARATDIANFWKLIDSLNWYAREHGLDQVSSMKLLGLLEDIKSRERFRNHIIKHIKSEHPAFELDELPTREFRQTKNTRA